MEPFLAFLVKHWVLSGLFLGISAMLIALEWRNRSHGLKRLNSHQAIDLMNHKSAVVVDVRDKEKYSQGHIIGACNLPEEDIEAKINTLNKHKSKPLILVCDNGLSSPKLGTSFTQKGFNEVYALAGGMENWKTDNMPVTK